MDEVVARRDEQTRSDRDERPSDRKCGQGPASTRARRNEPGPGDPMLLDGR